MVSGGHPSLDLRGSQHPYPVLPTTHLADLLSATGECMVNCILIFLFSLLCAG